MLHVFGESHTQIFSGIIVKDPTDKKKFFNVYTHWYTGALAFNVASGSKGVKKYGEQILSDLAQAEDVSSVMLVFGEVDVRVHLLKQWLNKHNGNVAAAYDDIVKGLVNLSRQIHETYKVPVFILAPIPSSPDYQGYNTDVPNTGSEKERNYFTYLMSRALEQEAEKTSGVYVVNLFHKLTKPDLSTNMALYADAIHIGHEGLAFFIEEFMRINECHNLGLRNYWALSEMAPNLHEPFKLDIVRKCRIKAISSSTTNDDCLYARPERGFCFQTKQQKNPYVLIDLGYAGLLYQINFHNHKQHPELLKGFEVEYSRNGSDFKRMHYQDEPFGLDGKPLTLKLWDHKGDIRYIRLKLNAETTFHLDRIELYEYKMLPFV